MEVELYKFLNILSILLIVQSLALLIDSSFTLSNDGSGMRNLSEKVSLDDFRSLYRVDMGSLSSNLTSYENKNEAILPTSSIAGPYSCVYDIGDGTEFVENVTINVRSMLIYNLIA